jgi:dihydrofolate reductase
VAGFWPTSTDEYAARMNEIPKVVFSKTLEDAKWPESTIAHGNLAEEIAALKRQPGGEIVAWGGASFAQALSREGLVDEYVLVTRPLAYGGGQPMFRDLAAPLEFELIEARTFGSSVVHIYRPSAGAHG